MSDTYESPCLVCELPLATIKRSGCDRPICPRVIEVTESTPDTPDHEALFVRFFTREGRAISFADTQPVPFDQQLALDTDPATLLTSLGGLEDGTPPK